MLLNFWASPGSVPTLDWFKLRFHHFLPQLWYEAKDEDGNIFYYHIKTSESRWHAASILETKYVIGNIFRWDAPPWGFLSIEEQEQIEAQQKMKEYSKEKIINEQREVHGERRKAEIIHKAMPDMSSKVGNNINWVKYDLITISSKDPYGRGGWAQVASEEEQRAQKEDALPDLGLPSKREKIQPVWFHQLF